MFVRQEKVGRITVLLSIRQDITSVACEKGSEETSMVVPDMEDEWRDLNQPDKQEDMRKSRSAYILGP